MNYRAYTLLYCFLLIAPLANAQYIRGFVSDKTNEPTVNALVSVSQNGLVKGSTLTDFDGKFSIDKLDSGKYNVVVVAVGYCMNTTHGVESGPFFSCRVDVKLVDSVNGPCKTEHVRQKTETQKLPDFTHYDTVNNKQILIIDTVIKNDEERRKLLAENGIIELTCSQRVGRFSLRKIVYHTFYRRKRH